MSLNLILWVLLYPVSVSVVRFLSYHSGNALPERLRGLDSLVVLCTFFYGCYKLWPAGW